MNSGATEDTQNIRVVDNPDDGQFEILVDGELAGLTVYLDAEPGVRTFPHTEVAEEFGGRGLSSQLIKEALDATRAAGLGVLPVCAAVRGFIAKRPEYLDLVPAARRAEFDL